MPSMVFRRRREKNKVVSICFSFWSCSAGLQAIEALQLFESLAINLLRRRLALIAELRWGILFKRPLSVAMAVAAPGSG